MYDDDEDELIECPYCLGTGDDPEYEDDMCTACSGTGEIPASDAYPQ